MTNTARTAYNAWRKGHETSTGGGWPDWDGLSPLTKARWVNVVYAVSRPSPVPVFLLGMGAGALVYYALMWLFILAAR